MLLYKSYHLFQTVSGLRLTDMFLKRTYEHDELAQVFIYNEDPEQELWNQRI